MENNNIFEYIKCSNNPVYFAEKYIKLHHIPHDKKFTLNKSQLDILKSAKDNPATFINLNRKAGTTTALISYIIHLTIFNTFKSIVMIYPTLQYGKDILEFISYSIENLPVEFKPPISVNNKTCIEFGNGSSIKVVSSNENSTRGMSPSIVIYENIDMFKSIQSYSNSIPALQHSNIIISSNNINVNLDVSNFNIVS